MAVAHRDMYMHHLEDQLSCLGLRIQFFYMVFVYNYIPYVQALALQVQARQKRLLNLYFYIAFVSNLTSYFVAYRVLLCIMSANFHVPSSAGDIMTHSLN